MRHRVLLSPAAREDFGALPARERAMVRDAIDRHLVHEPDRTSKSRIKRLRGVRRPQYRLRVGDVRVYYDVRGRDVEVLAMVEKSRAADWLARKGVKDEEDTAG